MMINSTVLVANTSVKAVLCLKGARGNFTVVNVCKQTYTYL